MFLLRETEPRVWEALLKPGSKIREGMVLEFTPLSAASRGGTTGATGSDVRPGDAAGADTAMSAGPRLTARVERTLSGGKRVVRLDPGEESMERLLEDIGRVPLPPYIDREAEKLDRERYQTVYARVPGAVAAPTAGLHFTGDVMNGVEARGGSFAKIVLHVGLGTFRPVAVEEPSEHEMDAERYEVTDVAAAAINAARAGGGRIVAVGTTAVRVLESVANERGEVAAGSGETALFITPPHRFRAVDVLLTNFHLPRSTLLMLVSAFAGREHVLAAYEEAVRERYRFYSYGDAMLIL